MHKHCLYFFLFLALFFRCDKELIAQSDNDKFKWLLDKSLNFTNKDNDSVIYYANLAYIEANSIADHNLELDALETLIRTNIKIGDFVKAQNYCKIANTIVNEYNLKHREAEVLINTGNVYLAIGLTGEALKIFLNAQNIVSLSLKIQDESYLNYLIAASYSDLGEINKAMFYSHLSINKAKKDNLLKGLFGPYMLLANSFTNIDSIQKYLSLTENLVAEYPNLHFERVVLLNNQALINKAVGNLALSKRQYLEAIRIASRNSYRNYLSTLYNNYAYQLMAEKAYDSAQVVLKLALSIAKNLKNVDLQATIYDSYSDYYFALSDFKSALTYKDSSIVARQNYRQQQRIQESLFLSALFESEQKEKELYRKEIQIKRLWVIALGFLAFFIGALGLGIFFKQKLSLSRSKLESVEKGKALEIADALIQGQDDERKRLAMDIHDGPVASMSSLRLMMDSFFKKHEKYQIIIESIMSVIHQLREVSHRMLPSHLREQGLVATIQHMAQSVNASGKFEVSVDIYLSVKLSEKMEVNLYYLIFELINNATKHSKGNAIFVQLINHEDVISLSVEDNGGGFDQSKTIDGMGLRNIKSRIEYLRGKMEIISDDNSTLFLIEIPIG